MPYKKGDAEIVEPNDRGGETSGVTDNRAEDPKVADDGWMQPVVTLPHSCGDWVIGGHAEVRQMIEDLTALLSKLPK